MTKENMKTTKRIGIIGFGNMGKAIVYGLLTYNMIDIDHLFISDRSEESEGSGLHITSDNKAVAKKADIIILSVKPQQISEVLQEIKEVVTPPQLIISVAAGISIKTIKAYLSELQPVIRIMPLLTAKIGLSMSVWITSAEVTHEQKERIRRFLKTFGEEAEVVSEEQVDAYTALAGGPAFVFYLAELLEQAAISLGFTGKHARLFATQIVFGSASLLEQSEEPAEALRKQVMSKGGTTEAAFRVFERANVSAIFIKGIHASKRRAEELRIG